MSRIIRGPKGSNELTNPPDPIQMDQWEDFLGTFPINRRDGVNSGPISTRNRKSRRVSGPAASSAKDLEYKGT